MASEGGPVNGTYVHQQTYGGADQHYGHPSAYAATASTPSTTAESAPSKPPSTEEVGWFFVERYYNTLSRTPEKLYVCHLPAPHSGLVLSLQLFYTKQSQFVAGLEEEKVPVCQGPKVRYITSLVLVQG